MDSQRLELERDLPGNRDPANPNDLADLRSDPAERGFLARSQILPDLSNHADRAWVSSQIRLG